MYELEVVVVAARTPRISSRETTTCGAPRVLEAQESDDEQQQQREEAQQQEDASQRQRVRERAAGTVEERAATEAAKLSI